MAGDVTAITGRSNPVNWFAVHFREKNVGDSLQYSRRGPFQQIREPRQQLALAHPDGVLYAGESEEFNLQFGDGRIGAEGAIRFLKDLQKVLPHVRLD
jgi:hypothetical protein